MALVFKDSGGKKFDGFYFRFPLFCLVFWGIPVVLCCFFFGMLWRENEDLQRARVSEKLDGTLSRLVRFRDTADSLSGLLNIVWAKVRSGKNPSQTRDRLIRFLKKKFPGTFRFVLLDGKGSLVPEISDWQPPRAVLKKFFDSYREASFGNWSSFNRSWSIFQSLLGPLVKKEDVKKPRISVASHRAENAFVFISQADSCGQMLVHISQTIDWDSMMIENRVRALNALRTPTWYFLFDLERRSVLSSPPAGISETECARIVDRFEATPQNLLTEKGKIWGQRVVQPTIRLLAVTPDIYDPRIQTSRMKLLSAGLLIFSVLTIATLLVMKRKWELYLSLRLKLVLLFLYTAGLPLTIMAINARSFLSQRRVALEARIHQSMEKSLSLFDKKLPIVLGVLQRKLRNSIGLPIPPGAPLLETAIARIETAVKLVNPSTVGLVDEDGNLLFDHSGGGSDEKKSMDKTFKQFYALLLKIINNPGDGLEEARKSKLSQVSSAGGIDMDALLGEVARSIKTVTRYQFGNKRVIQGSFPISSSDGKARFMAVFGWSGQRIEGKYVANFLKKASRSLPNSTLYAHNLFNTSLTRPKNFKFLPQVAPWLERIRAQNQPFREGLSMGQGKLLLTGIRGEDLSEYLLVAVTFDSEVRKELSRLWRLLFFIGTAVSAISVVVGEMLARKFLEPIGYLGDGVAALKRRDFTATIPVLDKDELGDLSVTFNRMMESLDDLECARIVQESLFPGEILESGDFRIFGKCVPATQVGGDYFDYFLSGNGDPLIILGDVAGHGVPAAIVMGMAKAVVAHPNTASDPAIILDHLNKVIAGTLKRKRMMTCFVGLLDKAGRKLVFSNGGQSDPILVRGGKFQPLVCRQMIVGIGKRGKYVNHEISLEPGDTIVFYTDGIFEARPLDGSEIGLDRFWEALPGLVRSDPRETEKSIRDWYYQVVGTGPQEDDITLVAVRYQPAISLNPLPID